MLMTIAGVFIAAILLVVSIFTKRAWLAKFTVGGVAIWFVFYAVMLVGFSLMSTDKALAINEPKEYCGFYLDCHIHTVVTGVRREKTIGDKHADGIFYIVGLKVFSDARNPDIVFRLLEPKARIVDADGNKTSRDTDAESKLPTAAVRLDQDIRGRQTIEKEIVFDLPSDIQNPHLDIHEGYGIDRWIEAVLIDDEDSIFHRRNYFKLQEQNVTAGVK